MLKSTQHVIEQIGRNTRRTSVLIGTLALMLLVPTGMASAHGAGTTDPETRTALQQAAEATAVLADVEFAAEAGYTPFPEGHPLHECIDSAEGAMGFHWVNSALLDTELDIELPEVLVYAPRPDGTLELVALEYVVFAEPWAAANPDDTGVGLYTVPTLFGRQLEYHSVTQGNNPFQIPSFWELHAWVHRPNPDGPFADFNPTVKCSY